MEPDPVAVVLAVAFHGVVGEVALGHLVVGINDHLRGTEVQFRSRNPELGEGAGRKATAEARFKQSHRHD